MDLSKVNNVLIISASIGSGHNRAANAVADELKQRYPAAQINVVDFMAGQNSYINRLVKETYLKLLDISPNIYDLLYRWTQGAQRGSKAKSLIGRIMKRSMAKLVNRYQPDLLITTHPFPCGAAAHLKAEGRTNTPLMAVITDFSVHRMWIYKEVDCYFVAAPEFKEQLAEQGIEREKIHVTGIPISPEFAAKVDGNLMIDKLGLDKNKPIILIMGGGLGLGGVKQALISLEEVTLPLQLIVITGRNSVLRHELKAAADSSGHLTQVLGFTKRISELMAIADILITKPGALTISEALAMKLPMLLYESIPGQEKDNAAWLESNGAATLIREGNDLAGEVTAMLVNEELRKIIEGKEAVLARPQAAADVVAVIQSQLGSLKY
ncbi:MAG: UDP-N-acetylglucosamine--LPS N-acetylglucosamine transferase [Pelosinus sp.]|nr:UDP-N-acetylglucosamine--LPS N-acetylglucosamine transferase [Pelosinus sp.]